MNINERILKIDHYLQCEILQVKLLFIGLRGKEYGCWTLKTNPIRLPIWHGDQMENCLQCAMRFPSYCVLLMWKLKMSFIKSNCLQTNGSFAL